MISAEVIVAQCFYCLSPYCVIALPFTLLSLYFLGSNPVLKGVGYRFLSIVGALSDMYNISTERTSRNLTRINSISRINCGKKKKNKCPWTRPEEATPTIWVYSPILFFGPIVTQNSCEIFICEITRRAWLHAEENKRRTLQRSDVASAVSRSDQFDFLIDIVPREEPPKMAKRASTREEPAAAAVSRIRVNKCLFEELCSLTFLLLIVHSSARNIRGAVWTILPTGRWRTGRIRTCMSFRSGSL